MKAKLGSSPHSSSSPCFFSSERLHRAKGLDRRSSDRIWDSQIKLKGDDKATADYLQHIKLTEKLEIRDVENSSGRGAGVRTLRDLFRKLSEDSASLAAAPPPPEPPPPTPPPSAEEQAAILAAVKEYALNYTKNLPNYVCIQTTRRRIEPTQRGYLPQETKFRRC